MHARGFLICLTTTERPNRGQRGDRRPRVWVPAVWALVLTLLSAFGSPQPALGQTVEEPVSTTNAPPYVPISGHERLRWVVDGNRQPKSLVAGVFVAGWETAWNLPKEWGQSWTGAGKRYLIREPHVAVSNALEASLGALWGEDPRYPRLGSGRLWPRVGYVIKTSFLAQGRDGRLRPAWARYAGDAAHSVIETTWLPPSEKTVTRTTLRFSGDFAGHLLADLWEEFWPDVRQALRERRH